MCTFQNLELAVGEVEKDVCNLVEMIEGMWAVVGNRHG
jgi:hypothetical protein